MEDGPKLQFLCCFFAGVATAVGTSPVDMAKARIMASKEKKMGTLKCLATVAKQDGIQG